MLSNIIRGNRMPAGKHEFEPTVSVIVPVRNGEATIPALLDSLMQLDYDKSKLEFQIVDGKSTDQTREIAERYPVNLITEDGDGLNAARNTGVRKSKSEIIAFTDADCIVPPDWVRSIVENFDDPEIGCVGGSIKGCNGDFLSDYADNSYMPVLRIFKKREVLDSVKLLQRYPAGANMAFRRKALEAAGDFDESIRHAFDEDELIGRVCQAGYKMALDPSCLVLHRHRSSLKELLKQNFRYGRGIGFLLKKRKSRDPISKWASMNLSGFAAWLFASAILSVLIFSSGWQLLYISALIAVLSPFWGMFVIYAYRALKIKHFERIIIYPFIDLLRMLAFSCGEIYQLFKNE